VRQASSKLPGDIGALMHATMAVCNFDPKQVAYASQQDVDCYFYRYYAIKCDGGGIWSDVRREKRLEEDEERLSGARRRRKRISRSQRMGNLAHRFTNAFFNFLYRVSGHPRCSRPLRTVIRTHLIDFTRADAVEERGWDRPFDVSQLDLRVSRDDIAHTNAEGMFTIERGELSNYCHDA
jgi:hypothetical protein